MEYITKNGEGDMAVMSLALYEQQQALLELYQKLGEAEAQSMAGVPLADFPHMSVVPKDMRLKSLNYRMLIIDNYLVFYVVRNQIVEIRRILLGKRKYFFLF